MDAVADDSGSSQLFQPAGDGRILSRVPLMLNARLDPLLVPIGSHQIELPRQAKTGHDPLSISGNGDALWRVVVHRSHSLLYSKSCARFNIPEFFLNPL